jgi:hypothetical protein
MDVGSIKIDKVNGDSLRGSIVAYPFPLSALRLNPGTRLATLMRRNTDYLLSLTNDNLMYNFRKTAGLPTPGSSYGGWEATSCGLTGHFVGHLLSACAKTYATSGDIRLFDKGNALVVELEKCQDTMKTGCLFASPTSIFDDLEKGGKVWAPYYTAHKIMAGLLDMYTYCGNTQALDICRKMATYFQGRMAKLTPAILERTLETRPGFGGNAYSQEFGGMSEVLHDLYKVTKDTNHLALANIFDRPWFVDMLSNNNDLLGYYALHANTHFPMVLGMASRYEMTGENAYKNGVLNFSEMMKTHTFPGLAGSNGMPPDLNRDLCENFSYPNQWYDQILSPNQSENCSSHNLNEIAEKAFSYTADPTYMDEFEKRFVNQVLSHLGPSAGSFTYFLNVKQGATKEYGSSTNTFWCCHGTGVEAFASLLRGAYFTDRQHTLWVTSFMAGSLTWAEKGLTLKQVTDFPEEQKSRFAFTLTTPQNLDVRLRVPYWAKTGVTVTVNGALQNVPAAPSSYISLNRTWNTGDVVELSLPFNLYTERLPDRPEYVVVKYGPQMLVSVADTGNIFDGTESALIAALTPVSGQLCTFQVPLTKGVKVFKPINRINNEVYNGYTIISKPIARTLLDSVAIGDSTSETSHGFQNLKSTTGRLNSRNWRRAPVGGWFSYTMNVDPSKNLQLRCTYWGGDDTTGAVVTYIMIDGQYLTAQCLTKKFPGKFFDMLYPIPQHFLTNKKSVVVTFIPKAKFQSARLFDCQMVYY